MKANMTVESPSVLEYLSQNYFLIPDYQRPYTWGEDECEQLWEDVVAFFEGGKNASDQNADKYFLGSVVVYEDKNRQNIVDGQQRTTTLMLLIKALFDKSSNAKNNTILNSMSSCLWEFDKKTERADTTKIRLFSEVALENARADLEDVLTGKYPPKNYAIEEELKKKQSKYKRNYLLFAQMASEFLEKNASDWLDFCLTLLDSCYLLFVKCEGGDAPSRLDNALRIFNTLNNRGTPLSDTDIFKSMIFNAKKDDEREEIIEDWRELERQNDGKDGNPTMDFIFRAYMHLIRAQNKITTSEIGLRNFFIRKHKDELLKPDAIETLGEISYFCMGDFCRGIEYSNIRARQFYDVLCAFPNEYWRYLNIVRFFTLERSIFFEQKNLASFLSALITHYFVRFIDKPTSSALKSLTYSAYASMYDKKYEGETVVFGKKSSEILEDEANFKAQFFKAKKLTPALLRLNLYLKFKYQALNLPAEIEHILPRKRKSYEDWESKAEAEFFIESIGNKTLLEKDLNSAAGDGNFDEKREKYSCSEFLEAKDLAKLDKSDWTKEDIEERNEEIYGRIREFFLANCAPELVFKLEPKPTSESNDFNGVPF